MVWSRQLSLAPPSPLNPVAWDLPPLLPGAKNHDGPWRGHRPQVECWKIVALPRINPEDSVCPRGSLPALPALSLLLVPMGLG